MLPCSEAVFEPAGLWMDPNSSNTNYIKIVFKSPPNQRSQLLGAVFQAVLVVTAYTPNLIPLKASEVHCPDSQNLYFISKKKEISNQPVCKVNWWMLF